MNPNNAQDRDELRLADLLRAVESDAPPPDAARLAALREQAADTFVGRALLPVLHNDQIGEPEDVNPRTSPIQSPGADALRLANDVKRSNRMWTFAWRGIALLATTAAAVVIGLLTTEPKQVVAGAVPFSEVLAGLREAETLQFHLRRHAGKWHDTEIWVRAPGLVRKEESPQRYEIAAGSRLWRVDEAANTVSEGDSPWFLSADKQIDLVGLLDVDVSNSRTLLRARPVTKRPTAHGEEFVYLATLPSRIGDVTIEAFADVATKRLTRMTVWQGEIDFEQWKWLEGHAAVIKRIPPLADMMLVAINVPIADDKFVVAKSLTEDGRIGKVSDTQGIVVLRPMLAKRWTPLCREMLLKPGDWLRTELRGANAVKVTLSSDVELTLGPGTLIECMSPTKGRLHSGQVQLRSPHAPREEPNAPATPESKQNESRKPSARHAERDGYVLLAPREGSRVFKPGDKQLVRVDRDEKLVDVPQTPLWLAGFEGTSNNESLGSLIVNLPEGRHEPLTVGYHKVRVEIRDQIARTTIEESFVNHTPGRLEGIFHFPLPQDASISGFGMWIGNDLIEADVVEKQRAREIYETILREKRDPGLLEWTGGNIFKARVFPIEPHSEKRIKIVYTQVLPLRANRYRYSYGLRSELLRTKPLRELSLTVTVNSALPLKSVTCPTHSARIVGWPPSAVPDEVDARRQDGRGRPSYHSAQIEFAAQEYTPTRDFEVVCEIDGRQSDVVVVPHRRGDDGYLLVQLTPPSSDGNWQRELLPDGQPLNLVLLCDTSASMDSEKRKQQAEFVATVLSSLGDEDRFLLACADVGTAWAFAEPVAANAANVAKARAFLDERVSLGWTNLDRAFDDTFKKAPTDAHILYIGDGIVSSGDTDPAAFLKRLGALQRSRHALRDEPNGGATSNSTDDSEKSERQKPSARHAERDGYVHAIGVGNSFESVALKGIASVGGGSVRNISGEQTPQVAALELLNEIAQPGLRDLNVEFHGLKIAAVYPDQLPNVSAGTQQILVGRYLPKGKDQFGEIVVTGQRGSEKVRYTARVNFKDAEDGNSFIPRLWARAHLDRLLAQGQNQFIRDEVIRLSEEFHIITPYTSLLVLETDADRERFGVKRRYEMRDGERFFAEGRDNANYELLQQQMKRAGDWRLGLRRDVLRSLAGLGRNPQALQQQVQIFDRRAGFAGRYVSEPVSSSTPLTAPWGASDWYFQDGAVLWGGGLGGAIDELLDVSRKEGEFLSDLLSVSEQKDPKDSIEELRLGLRDREEDRRSLREEDSELLAQDFEVGQALALDSLPKLAKRKARAFDMPLGEPAAAARLMAAEKPWFAPTMGFGREDFLSRGGRFAGSGYYHQRPDYTSWLNTLFPALAASPSKPQPPLKDPESWSPEAIALSKSLLRLEALLKLEGGIELRRVTEGFDPRWKRRSSRSNDLVLYSPSSWLTRPTGLTDQTVIQFCDTKERGVFSLAFGLGRVRASVEQELKSPPLGLADYSLSPVHESYRAYVARVEPAGENRAKLILSVKNSTHEEHFLIDTAKHVLVKREWFDDSKSGGAVTYDDFVEVAGSWWAKKSTTTDAQGRTTAETTFDIQSLGKDQYGQRIAAELAAKPKVQFLRLPFVKLKTARQKVADGSAGFDDRLTMILHNATLQQWDEMWKHVEAAEKLALADKPGVRWMRTILFSTIRRNEEARQRLLAEAKQLATNRQQDEVFLAEFVHNQAYSLSSWPEFLTLVETLKPVYERQPAELDVMPQWQERLAQCYDGVGRYEEALALRRSLVEKSPWHLHWQTDFANRLLRAGQVDAAFAWLQKELDRPIERTSDEQDALRTAYADLYRTQARWADLLKFTTEWIARKPESWSYNSAYAQHLAALIHNDQLDAANALVEQWFREARIEGKLAPDQRARLETAINFANGSAYNLSYQRADEHWFDELAETIRFFLRHKHHSDIGTRGIGNHYFLQSDVADRLRGEFLSLLQSDLANLRPAQINILLGWTLSGRIELTEPLNGRKQLEASEVPAEIWKKITAELKPRWLQSQDKDEKYLLSESLRSIYANRFVDSELLPFLRERLAAVVRTPTSEQNDMRPDVGVRSTDYRTAYVSSLFETLLTTKWSDAVEKEAFTLLLDLSDAKEPADRLTAQLPALHRLVDAMLANRQSLAESQLGDQGEQNKLTRKELAAKKADIRKAAREQLAARLTAEVDRTPTSDQDRPDVGVRSTVGLARWMRIEKAWLDVQLDQNLAQVEGFCWQTLGEAPPKQDDEAEDDEIVTEPTARQRFFDAQLKQRAFMTVMNLSARRKAEPATIDRVLKFIDAGIAHGGDVAETWRGTKFRLLIALDRPDDLERELREWIRSDVSTAPWRQMLARLVAERGKLDEAIQLFEACEKDKLLSAADYRMLADWSLVSNRREAYERSRIEAFKQMPEHQLSNLLYQVSNRWMRQDDTLPSELDESTLFVVQALFEKSAQPENYLWQHSNLYGACRDFRLLRMLPDAVLGRSPQQVYRFLQTLQSAALGELRNEATADEILARIRQLRASGMASAPRQSATGSDDRRANAAPFAGALTTTDLRALDLLEVLVERKSSEVLNQPGPHIDACVAALQRAFQRKWSDGEPRMMSNFLYQFGGLPNEKLKAEQLRELRELQRLAPANSRDHLVITTDLCNLLFWSYGQNDSALREMETEVRAYTQANDGLWPHLDNELLSRYVSMLEGTNQHAAGETVLKKSLAKPANDEQRKWLGDRLMSLYNHALEHDGAVSLCTGRAKLFEPIVALTRQELAAAPDENVRYNLVTRLVTTFDIARRHQLPATADVVRKFAFEELPSLLKRQQSQYRNTVTTPMHIIGEVLGPKLALQYVVERMEQYPQRLEIQWDNSWSTFGYELARRRHESEQAKLDIKELEPRVLKLTIAEMKRELRSGENRNHHIHHKHSAYFWPQKEADFAQAAEEVLAERRSSGRRAVAVANYLWSSLDRAARAIEILLLAHKNGLLDEAAQVQLVNWLHQLNRWAESIPLLEPLVRDRPDNIQYRTLLMIAYDHSQRPEQLAELVQQTDAHFHAGGRWSEGNVSQFARGCLSCNLNERAAGYFNEAIALHQRSNPGIGLGDGTLSDLYQHLALAQSALGRTQEAVAAAAAAIVCWGPRDDQRRSALENLRTVLRNSKDLDEFVQHLDTETAKTGQDSPILRKAVGQTYQSRNEHAKAIAQLQLSAELQPHDQEVHQALIACYDAMQNGQAASKQLLKLIDLNRHDLALYQQLAERLKDNEAEAERAATSIIEASPNEAENHAAMAELRQKQNRWAEAIPHWWQVAELRRLEPAGLLKLAEAQLHEKQWDEARRSIDKLQMTEWPSRFADVANQTRQLLERLPKP